MLTTLRCRYPKTEVQPCRRASAENRATVSESTLCQIGIMNFPSAAPRVNKPSSSCLAQRVLAIKFGLRTTTPKPRVHQTAIDRGAYAVTRRHTEFVIRYLLIPVQQSASASDLTKASLSRESCDMKRSQSFGIGSLMELKTSKAEPTLLSVRRPGIQRCHTANVFMFRRPTLDRQWRPFR